MHNIALLQCNLGSVALQHLLLMSMRCAADVPTPAVVAIWKQGSVLAHGIVFKTHSSSQHCSRAEERV